MSKSNFSYVGKSIHQTSSSAKVTGKAIYAADIFLPDMLYVEILRSDRPHAVIKSIDYSRALTLTGVEAVITAENIPGRNSFGVVIKDQPVLAKERVRFYGEAIAAVAAKNYEDCSKALKMIKVEYEELPVVNSIDLAMSQCSIKLHPKGNLLLKQTLRKGNINFAESDCEFVVEETYKTHSTAHVHLETEAGVAVYDNGEITLYVSTQNPHYDRSEVAAVLGIPESKVRVIQTVTGGGFGSKQDISVQCILATMAQIIKRPVKLVYDMAESFASSVKRHPCLIKCKLGGNYTGKVNYANFEVWLDTGAYASHGPSVVKKIISHVTGAYEIPNVKADVFLVYTNNTPCGAMRGFGTPQMNYAIESGLDRVANRISRDPLEIRLINSMKIGSLTATGHALDSGVKLIDIINIVTEKAKWHFKRKQSGLVNSRLTGIGMACCMYGIGYTGIRRPSAAVAEILSDGSVSVLCGAADIGQGSDMVLKQIAAEAVGVGLEHIRLTSNDTAITPDSGATSASRQTLFSGNAVLMAVKNALKLVHEGVAEKYKLPVDELINENGKIYSSDGNLLITLKEAVSLCIARGVVPLGCAYYCPDTTPLDDATSQGFPYITYTFGASVAEVEVDSYSGKIEVTKLYNAFDVGTAINPRLVEGQIEGAVAMGVGQALFEDYEILNGIPKTVNLNNYLVPTILDMPEIDILIIEEPDLYGPFGAKGIGEPALCPIPAAIANALYHATGKQFCTLPISLEQVFQAMNDSTSQTGLI